MNVTASMMTSARPKENVDTRFFSQRAKDISLLNEQMKPAIAKPSSPSEVRFQFSNRTYVPIAKSSSTSTGIEHGNTTLPTDCRPNVSIGRGRTTVPLSSFVLQKDNLSTTSPTKANMNSTPIFVMHDEVQFVRPYFGPRNSNENSPTSALTLHKRAVLLSALKEIESGLKTL
ncbi:unnamed protein product [Adineta ricciae]|uniref:Uncharacterized protein n=1 Tax=Adineta ricciae TaxID=249248 RepID=A0A814QHD2_ADIRI|nr:unnamed protein product [Adineta ricciae]CAF1336831.1 unnamed protein product [Adineta ricciae]